MQAKSWKSWRCRTATKLSSPVAGLQSAWNDEDTAAKANGLSHKLQRRVPPLPQHYMRVQHNNSCLCACFQ
jgi:hypothetical protein